VIRRSEQPSVAEIGDGAVEISNGRGQQLGSEGLSGILRKLGYPGSGTSFETIEGEMLDTRIESGSMTT